ncbi:cupin domain-containing protein [Nocardia niwae]|uniref:cupin domain-containing protein n=1 Tax=Nocardia niwae TaxID=626084 RepID=UPI0007A4DC3B|nr:AraC family ligand binding domain-containing protein [Nocardia niwae]
MLAERWTVREGQRRFRIDGAEILAGPGDTVTAPAGTVHEFHSVVPATVIEHEIRPPLRHWEMFRLWHDLGRAGKTTAARVPRDEPELCHTTLALNQLGPIRTSTTCA